MQSLFKNRASSKTHCQKRREWGSTVTCEVKKCHTHTQGFKKKKTNKPIIAIPFRTGCFLQGSEAQCHLLGAFDGRH